MYHTLRGRYQGSLFERNGQFSGKGEPKINLKISVF
jgi:hypothetical protein